LDFYTISRLNRFKSIILTLAKYGFGDLVSRLDLPEKLFHLRPRREAYTERHTWERIRYVMAELGPTFVKFGQILSLRTDLIPAELAQELSKLEDEVPPEDFSALKEHMERSMALPFDEVFADFEPEPLAAASLAQVHRAILRKDKSVVAVKVQRPGIRRTITNDLDILAGLARQLHERIETLTVYNLPQLVNELRRLMLQELDFEREARNMRVAKSNFANEPFIYLPKVYTEYTTSRVLVMELINGRKLRDVVGELSEESRKALAVKGLQASMKQILRDGFFHADPHPGNIFILPDNRYSLLDWGMIGRLTPETQMKLITLLHGVVEKDSEAILEVFLSLTEQKIVPETNALHRDIMDILDDYYSVPLKEINMGQLLTAMTNLFQNYRIVLQADLAIMVKALITSEGSARLLHPELNVIAEAKPYVAQVAREKLSPWNLQRQFRKGAGKLFKMQKDLPKQLNTILYKLEHDQLSIGFEHKRLEGMRLTLEHTANRVTLGVITAALIIGSSMVITTGVKPLLFGYPALGLVGFLLSGFVGAWLIFDILRKRKL